MKIIGDGGHAAVVRTLEFDDPDGWIIAVGNNRARRKEALERIGYHWAIARHRLSHCAEDVQIGEGTVIMAGVIVQAHARIGKHCIINTGATIDHHCTLEDFVHIAPGAHLCGNVKVGEGTLVGVGVGIAPNTIIPPWSLVKAARLDIEPISGN